MVALLLTLALFPEIVLAGGSLSLAQADGVVDHRTDVATVSLRPNPEDLGPKSQQRDPGSQVWQFEATTRHVRHTLRAGDDPFWNPWTASGQRGPETLVGMQLSPVVLTIAALGAGATAFTFVLLALVALGLYCLQQFATEILGLPRVAAVGAGVVFALNGWTTGTLGGLTGVPYLLFPLVLYALTAYHRHGGPLRFLFAVAAYATLFASTFLPGVVLVLLIVHVVALTVEATSMGDRPGVADGATSRLRRAGRLLARQVAAPVVGVLVAAVVLVPLAVALAGAGPDMATYGDRTFRSSSLVEYVSVLTPRHGYTSYVPETLPEHVPPGTWTIYLGLAPILLVGSAWRSSRGRDRRLLRICVALTALSLAMHLVVPGSALVARFPAFQPIGASYWSSLAAMAMTVAVAVAVAVGRRQGWDGRVAAPLGAGLVAAVGAAVLAEGPATRSVLAFASATVFVGLVVVLVTAVGRQPTRRNVLVAAAVALLAVELVSYQNPVRPRRAEITADLPAYVDAVRSGMGDGRILNAGAGAIPPEWGAALRIRQVGTITHVQIPEYTEFFTRRVEGRGDRVNRFLRVARNPGEGLAAQPEALDLLSVRFLVVDQRFRAFLEGATEAYPIAFEDEAAGVTVFENPDAWPRARLATEVMPTSRRGTTEPLWSRHLTTTSDRGLLEAARLAGVPVGLGGSGGRATGEGEARITSETSTEVRIAVESDRPAVLVLADAHHPDWHAEVDGVAVPMGLVDETVRGVVVPAGASEVVFRYRPTARDVGAAVSALSLLGLLLGCAVWSRRRRVGTASGSSGVAPGPVQEA